METPLGPVGRKTGTGYGVSRSKPEYADLAAAARTGGVSLEEALGAWGSANREFE